MQAPPWIQRVLLVTAPDITNVLSQAFVAHTQLAVCHGFENAVAQLDRDSFHVLILDQEAVASSHEMFELAQYASQLNQKLTIILLMRKATVADGQFARKCGAALIMDRQNIQVDKITYVIRVLRKRTFRAVLERDLLTWYKYPVPLYLHLPMNNHYVVCVPAGEAYTEQQMEKSNQIRSKHLFVREKDFDTLVAVLDKGSLTGTLALLRQRFQNLLIDFFDFSTDAQVHYGKQMLSEGYSIIEDLEKITQGFAKSYECLELLCYPRWSAIAHGLNCALYSILFAKICGIPHYRDLALAALIHNIGFAEIRQEVLAKPESALDEAELSEYMGHIEKSLHLIRRKSMPISPMVERIISEHHANYDGTGFPQGLKGDKIAPESSLVTIAASFDYFKTLRPEGYQRTPKEAWEALKVYHTAGSAGGLKFDPEWLQKIDTQLFAGV